MARKISLTSGSIFNGNPITFAIAPQVLSAIPSFHRVIVDVKCGMSGGNYETIRMSVPVEQESAASDVLIDISSALRTFRDMYEYSSEPVTYPYVSFQVTAFDEYMVDGVVSTQQGVVQFPSETTYLRTVFGGFSDMERLTSASSKAAKRLSRKPTRTPHLAYAGETFVYPVPYEKEQTLEASESLSAPISGSAVLDKEGAMNVVGQNLFVLPASEAKHRVMFRMINSFGMLESVSVPREYSKKMSVQSDSYVLSRQETFNKFSRSAVRKQNDCETWSFSTDPLTEDWLYWYLHEFMTSEHVWICVHDTWVPCVISVDDEVTFMDRTQDAMYVVTFTATFDINGSPLLMV